MSIVIMVQQIQIQPAPLCGNKSHECCFDMALGPLLAFMIWLCVAKLPQLLCGSARFVFRFQLSGGPSMIVIICAMTRTGVILMVYIRLTCQYSALLYI